MLCHSNSCKSVADDRGRHGPRYLRAKAYRLWRSLTRSLRLDACPICRQEGTLVPACPLCRKEISLEPGKDLVLAVVGASKSGKTHYLATVLHQLLEAGIGGDTWVASMPDEDRKIYREELLKPLFEDRRELARTPNTPGPELRLTLENSVTGKSVLVVFRDLGGEAFERSEEIGRHSFLRYAQGILLLADPLAFSRPRVRGPDEVEPWFSAGGPNAISVLANYRRALEAQGRYPEHRALPLLPERKVLAIVVTKADLVLPQQHAFWNGHDASYLEAGYWQQRRPASDQTREWVARCLSPELTDSTLGFADVGYFFVSNYGYRHEPGTVLTRPPEPRRVHEPLFALVDYLSSGEEPAKSEVF